MGSGWSLGIGGRGGWWVLVWGGCSNGGGAILKLGLPRAKMSPFGTKAVTKLFLKQTEPHLLPRIDDGRRHPRVRDEGIGEFLKSLPKTTTCHHHRIRGVLPHAGGETKNRLSFSV